jgi:flagellar biosynthesis/type III secretory pathway M-ring protein FliF/YscJ
MSRQEEGSVLPLVKQGEEEKFIKNYSMVEAVTIFVVIVIVVVIVVVVVVIVVIITVRGIIMLKERSPTFTRKFH